MPKFTEEEYARARESHRDLEREIAALEAELAEAGRKEQNVWGLIVEIRGALNLYRDEHDPGAARDALSIFGAIIDMAIKRAQRVERRS